MPNDVGAMLREAREQVGMSTRTVAMRLASRGYRISHASIANYEAGKSPPPLPLLMVLSDLYQKQIKWFLAGSDVLTQVQYRALKGVKASQRNVFEMQAERLLGAYVNLETSLGLTLLNEHPDFRAKPDEPGRNLASRLRHLLDIGENPVASVIAALERFGIRTIEIQSKARIDACAACFRGERVVIINSGLPNDRVRLTAAHELGHHLYEDGGLDTLKQADIVEARAFEFASHFLLPESRLREAFFGYSMVRLVEYKQTYGVSLAAMIYRAEKAGLLMPQVARQLWMEFSKRGWRKNEPGTVLPDRPRRFQSMLDRCTRSGARTWSQVARITRVREPELRAILGSGWGV